VLLPKGTVLLLGGFQKARSIKVKLSGNVEEDIELNKNTLGACIFSKGCISKFSGMS